MTNRILHTKVAGVTFEGRQAYLAKIRTSDPCRIEPEPMNQYDPNALAVKVSHDGEILHVGYIPKLQAGLMAQFLDCETLTVRIKEITGGFQKEDGSTASLGMELEIEYPPLESQLSDEQLGNF